MSRQRTKLGRTLALTTAAAMATFVFAAPANAAVPTISITEVAPWGSSTLPYSADWFELTNTGSVAVNISGWKMDDNSNSFAVAVALIGVTSIGPGESVIFLESSTPATTIANFKTAWFGATPPPALQIGTYSGSGVGLSATVDAVNVFDGTGSLVTRVDFNASTANKSFDNTVLANNVVISTLSAVGVNGAFLASDGTEIGSPGIWPSPSTVVSDAPYAVLLSVGAVMVLGGGVVVMRRRRMA